MAQQLRRRDPAQRAVRCVLNRARRTREVHELAVSVQYFQSFRHSRKDRYFVDRNRQFVDLPRTLNQCVDIKMSRPNGVLFGTMLLEGRVKVLGAPFVKRGSGCVPPQGRTTQSGFESLEFFVKVERSMDYVEVKASSQADAHLTANHLNIFIRNQKNRCCLVQASSINARGCQQQIEHLWKCPQTQTQTHELGCLSTKAWFLLRN